MSGASTPPLRLASTDLVQKVCHPVGMHAGLFSNGVSLTLAVCPLHDSFYAFFGRAGAVRADRRLARMRRLEPCCCLVRITCRVHDFNWQPALQ